MKGLLLLVAAGLGGFLAAGFAMWVALVSIGPQMHIDAAIACIFYAALAGLAAGIGARVLVGRRAG